MSEKKNLQEVAGWATAHFGARSRYNRLYLDTAGHRAAEHTVGPCDTTEQALRYGQLLAQHGCPVLGASGNARGGPCHWRVSRHGLRYGAWGGGGGGCDMARGACDTTRGRPRYGTLRATTRRLGCAHCASNPILTQCTVQSHCLDHCS